MVELLFALRTPNSALHIPLTAGGCSQETARQPKKFSACTSEQRRHSKILLVDNPYEKFLEVSEPSFKKVLTKNAPPKKRVSIKSNARVALVYFSGSRYFQ